MDREGKPNKIPDPLDGAAAILAIPRLRLAPARNDSPDGFFLNLLLGLLALER
jgi:hypothetical protein